MDKTRNRARDVLYPLTAFPNNCRTVDYSACIEAKMPASTNSCNLQKTYYLFPSFIK